MEALDSAQRASRLAAIEAEDESLALELRAMLDPPARLARDEAQLDRMALSGGLAAGLSRQRLPEFIGPYRILSLLGEGGMGRVFEAEQRQPVRRRVALKLASGILLSDTARARFQAERQALAVLDHPHIAKVFDTGDTPDGQPWFAMELVDGVPITRWAAQHALDLRQRIELLLPICDAVQHAHQKGLIHRDLKPANLLVADVGGVAHPRVIDFGVAKDLTRPRESLPHATRAGDLLGTPEYMSPEQAALGEIDIDTRTDVYALGLVLYELLTGRLPVGTAAMRGASFGELCRSIREAPVPLPSRHCGDPSTPVRGEQLRGDLDRVLLKALAKDREQRYASVAAFADDLRRFLQHQPVLAMPPSLRYRLAKFVRRNRALVVAASVAIVALISATLVAGLGLIEARESEQRALAAAAVAERERRTSDETTAFLVDLFRAADPINEAGLEVTAGDLLRRGEQRIDALAGQPEIQAELMAALGGAYYGLGESGPAEALLRGALALRSEGDVADPYKRAAVGNRLADLLRESSRYAEAEQLYRMGLDTLSALGRLGVPDEIVLLNGLGVSLIRIARLEEAEQAFRRALQLVEALPEDPFDDEPIRRNHRVNLLGSLVGLYAAQWRNAEAAAVTRELIEELETALPEGHPNIAILHANLSVLLAADGELGAALRHADHSVALTRQSLGPEHPRTAIHLFHLGSLQWRLGRFDAAADSLTESISIYRRVFDEQHHELIRPTARLAQVRLRQGRTDAALMLADRASRLLGLAGPVAPGFDPALLRLELARLYFDAGRIETATQLLADARRPMPDREGSTANTELLARSELLEASIELRGGRLSEARRLLEVAAARLGCGPDSCLLDRPVAGTMRAEVLVGLGETKAGLQLLDAAIAAPGWKVWMLELPQLEPLRTASEWPALGMRLNERLAD